MLVICKKQVFIVCVLLVNKVSGRKVHGGLLILPYITCAFRCIYLSLPYILNQIPCRYSRMQGKGQATGAIPC